MVIAVVVCGLIGSIYIYIYIYLTLVRLGIYLTVKRISPLYWNNIISILVSYHYITVNTVIIDRYLRKYKKVFHTILVHNYVSLWYFQNWWKNTIHKTVFIYINICKEFIKKKKHHSPNYYTVVLHFTLLHVVIPNSILILLPY